MNLFPETFSVKKARIIQQFCAKRVIKETHFTKVTTITGVDVSYRGNKACAALVTLNFPQLEKIEQVSAISEIQCPYIPGFLSFREGPPVIKAFMRLKQKPQVLVFDGHGIAHPEGAGLATHMGIYFDTPSIGCAKGNLYGEYEEPMQEKGSYSIIKTYDNCIGAVLRTRKGIRPVFVSVGHLIDLEKAIEIVLAACKGFRIPEPVRQSHILCREVSVLIM